MENRRLFTAVFISALILIVWNYVFPPVPQIPAPTELTSPDRNPEGLGERDPGTPGSEDSERVTALGVDGEIGDPKNGDFGPAATAILDFAEDTLVAEREEVVVLENLSVRLEFSNRGAQLVSFLLKEDPAAGKDRLELVRERGSDPYPFGLVVGGDKSHRLNNALFETSRVAGSGEGSEILRFRHSSERGAAEKVFRLSDDGLLSVDMTVLGSRDWSVVFGPGLRNLSESELESRFIERNVGYSRGGELETISARKQEEDEFVSAVGLRWVTLEDNFFLTAILPEEGVREVTVRPVLQRTEVLEDEPRFLPIGTPVDDEGTTPEQMLLLEASGHHMEITTLFGAKRYSRLSKLPYGLEDTVRWGRLGFLSKPLYFALEWIHTAIVPNYGWAIILVTCLIKILFFPLTYKSQESMGKMQELNPKVQAIRNKYRSKLKDRQGRPNADATRQMNEEVMQVYKTAGVNPASGCLPILLQAPVFFAFFRLLSTAVELRNAPWLGWITDLSVADPNYVLPLVMGGTSVALQRMMPAAPDPMQRRMMQFLPIMFTVFAFQFPSGLLLYWITNNVLSMAQQSITMKIKQNRTPSS